MQIRRHTLLASAARRGAYRCLLIAGFTTLAAAPAARAQGEPNLHREWQVKIDTSDIKRSGPRYGALWLSVALADSISAHNKNQKVNPMMSLFGWEFESELLRNPNGATPVTNLVIGVAGLDQGLVLPTATWLVGMRTKDDFEAGIGPNISPAGPALALTVGMTLHSGRLNIPLDVAYVSSKIGTRVSFSTGFNVMQ
jgi:hypothetical protein